MRLLAFGAGDNQSERIEIMHGRWDPAASRAQALREVQELHLTLDIELQGRMHISPMPVRRSIGANAGLHLSRLSWQFEAFMMHPKNRNKQLVEETC